MGVIGSGDRVSGAMYKVDVEVEVGVELNGNVDSILMRCYGPGQYLYVIVASEIPCLISPYQRTSWSSPLPRSPFG